MTLVRRSEEEKGNKVKKKIRKNKKKNSFEFQIFTAISDGKSICGSTSSSISECLKK